MSYESDLETRLRAYNAKIEFWSKIQLYLSKIKLGKLVLKRIVSITLIRDDCFRELRELMRKKYPERFIQG